MFGLVVRSNPKRPNCSVVQLINSNRSCLDFAPYQTMLDPALTASGFFVWCNIINRAAQNSFCLRQFIGNLTSNAFVKRTTCPRVIITSTLSTVVKTVLIKA